MFLHRRIRAIGLTSSFLAISLALPAFAGADAASAQDRSPTALQLRLDKAEEDFKAGKVDLAIAQAQSLIDVRDGSFFESDWIARDAKADLALFELKAGQPDQTAKLMRELLLSLQLELPMDPRYSQNPAQVLSESIKTLKDYFSTVMQRLGCDETFKPIINSIIDNTVPKNYGTLLKSYCGRMQAAMDQLQDLQSVADAEELKYGDALRPLDDVNSSSPEVDLSPTKLEKLGKDLEALGVEAQQLPVGDVRAALSLYKLALVANSAQRYEQAQGFVQKAIDQLKAMNSSSPMMPQLRLVLAYSVLKQGHLDEFKALRDDLLKGSGDEERALVTLARFTEASGDKTKASEIYKRAMDNRLKRGNKQSPEWLDSYNELLKGAASPN